MTCIVFMTRHSPAQGSQTGFIFSPSFHFWKNSYTKEDTHKLSLTNISRDSPSTYTPPNHHPLARQRNHFLFLSTMTQIPSKYTKIFQKYQSPTPILISNNPKNRRKTLHPSSRSRVACPRFWCSVNSPLVYMWRLLQCLYIGSPHRMAAE